jgi:hypothetical protein
MIAGMQSQEGERLEELRSWRDSGRESGRERKSVYSGEGSFR